MKVAGLDMATQARLDDFEIVYNGASGGVPLSAGVANTIRVRAKDSAGLYSPYVTVVVTQGATDSELPVVAITSPTANTSQVTSTATIALAGTWTDNIAAVSGACGAATATPTSRAMVINADGTWTLVGTFSQASGDNDFTCTGYVEIDVVESW
jgi:hypothetical protein